MLEFMETDDGEMVPVVVFGNGTLCTTPNIQYGEDHKTICRRNLDIRLGCKKRVVGALIPDKDLGDNIETTKGLIVRLGFDSEDGLDALIRTLDTDVRLLFSVHNNEDMLALIRQIQDEGYPE